jgi:hypothetical protein
MTACHSAKLRPTTENMSATKGTYRMKKWSKKETAIAPSSHRLLHGRRTLQREQPLLFDYLFLFCNSFLGDGFLLKNTR